MIVRMLRGRAAAGRPDDDPAHFNNAALPELHKVPGFVNAVLLDGDAIRGDPMRPIQAAFRLTSLGKIDMVRAMKTEHHTGIIIGCIINAG